MGELGELVSISLSGYGLAFAIIALIVAIPYLIVRRELSEEKPSPPPSPTPPSRGVEGVVEPEIVAAAVAAALHVHEARRVERAAIRRRYSTVSSWGVASRLDALQHELERGWGARRWRGSRC